MKLHDICLFSLRYCLLCSQKCKQQWLCNDCLSSLKPIGTHCQTCAQNVVDPRFPCGYCLTKPSPLDALYVAYHYQGVMREVLLQAKYGKNRAALMQLGYWSVCLTNSIPEQIDVIIPMPMAWHRLLQRGFNQTHYLAQAAAQKLGVRCDKRILHKARRTPQSILNTDGARRRNIRGAFSVRKPVDGHVLLIDDVLTSGATVHEAATTLKASGTKRVSVLVIAAR